MGIGKSEAKKSGFSTRRVSCAKLQRVQGACRVNDVARNVLRKLKDKKAPHLLQYQILDHVGYFMLIKFCDTYRHLGATCFSRYEPVSLS